MSIFGKKEREVEKLIEKHFTTVKKTVKNFPVLLKDYLEGNKQFKDDSFTIHKLEHDADVIRKEVEIKMSSGAFLPVFREDYIVFMETLDMVANRTEQASDYLVLTRPNIPENIKGQLLEMAEATIDIMKALEKMYCVFIEDIHKVMPLGIEIEKKEQAIDKIQWNLVKTIFKSEHSLSEKMVLKDLVDKVASISDFIEDVSDRLVIMVVKRAM